MITIQISKFQNIKYLRETHLLPSPSLHFATYGHQSDYQLQSLTSAKQLSVNLKYLFYHGIEAKKHDHDMVVTLHVFKFVDLNISQVE